MIFELHIHCTQLNMISHLVQLEVLLGEGLSDLFEFILDLIVFNIVLFNELSEFGLFHVVLQLIHDSVIHRKESLIYFFFSGKGFYSLGDFFEFLFIVLLLLLKLSLCNQEFDMIFKFFDLGPLSTSKYLVLEHVSTAVLALVIHADT